MLSLVFVVSFNQKKQTDKNNKQKYKIMEHVKRFEKLMGVDAGYHESAIHPANGVGRVGKRGMDKNLTLLEMIEIVYNMEEKPNIIVKGGPNAKWYIKKINPEILYREIEKQSWRDTSRCTMYIIEWD